MLRDLWTKPRNWYVVNMCKVDIFKIDAEKVLFILNDKTLHFLAGTNGFRSYGVTNEGSTEISDST